MHEPDREHDSSRPGSGHPPTSVRSMETALRESEDLLRTVITGAPVPVPVSVSEKNIISRDSIRLEAKSVSSIQNQ